MRRSVMMQKSTTRASTSLGTRSVFNKSGFAGGGGDRRSALMMKAARAETVRKFKIGDDRVSFTDLFFWALASGQPQLVQILWSRVQEPLRCAVVGVEACRRISKKYFSRGRGKASAKRLLASIEIRLEDGLVGILDNISRPQAARSILVET